MRFSGSLENGGDLQRKKTYSVYGGNNSNLFRSGLILCHIDLLLSVQQRKKRCVWLSTVTWLLWYSDTTRLHCRFQTCVLHQFPPCVSCFRWLENEIACISIECIGRETFQHTKHSEFSSLSPDIDFSSRMRIKTHSLHGKPSLTKNETSNHCSEYRALNRCRREKSAWWAFGWERGKRFDSRLI